MRILVVGAGGTGGYFGGRLLQAGRDVTFLVRPRRADQLARTGLVIRSSLGDATLESPPTVTAPALRDSYDLVLLATKAYDLDGVAADIAPAVGPHTMILPLLNGMRHLDVLDAGFGAEHVLGGLCFISATLGPDGEILHLNSAHQLTFGERDGARSTRIERVAETFGGARFDARVTDVILQEMWEKWVFIAAGAGVTCLMRAAVGDVVAAGGADVSEALLDECAAIAGLAGFPPRDDARARSRSAFTARDSTLTASMMRDIERGAPTEADHVIGDLLRRNGGAPNDTPLLRLAYLHLRSYAARRAREERRS